MSGASGSRSSGVIGRAVGHHLHEVSSLFAPPHDNPPSLAGEGGIQFPQHKNKHTSQARGDEARKAQGGRKKNLHLVFRGRWTIARLRGGLPTPLSGA
eukprot:scaffold3721_cov134-Isochrysis_galbana.AAC.13